MKLKGHAKQENDIMERIAKDAIRRELLHYQPMSFEQRARITSSIFLTETGLDFELYFPGTRPEDAVLLVRAQVDRDTKKVVLEVVNLSRKTPGKFSNAYRKKILDESRTSIATSKVTNRKDTSPYLKIILSSNANESKIGPTNLIYKGDGLPRDNCILRKRANVLDGSDSLLRRPPVDNINSSRQI